MATNPGLVPHNLRLGETPEAANDIVIEVSDGGQDQVKVNDDGSVTIQHPDGSITIDPTGKSLQPPPGPTNWFDNLVEKIDHDELSRIADDLLRGIDADITARKDWITDRETGIKLLGLKIEVPGVAGAADGAPVEGMSKVRHPLLLEAVLRFQANARAELLPTDGPVKIRNDDTHSVLQVEQSADALEMDMNHYLTKVATEYYPDTDRMLFMLGFGGTSFKKIYFCPLRMRPVSESVDADDLIVNNTATDLSNALRITHRIMMRPSTVKRLQILGVYRDITLSDPNQAEIDPLKREEAAQQGVDPTVNNPADRDREIYECYCELDVKGFEHKHKGRPSGLEIPYRVTIDVSSREILSIVRNYNDHGDKLPRARKVFVKYIFVPGIGFYDVGLLHIGGNTVNALTAAWRLMLDNGMFANFPGFLFSDFGGRQDTSIFRVPPGGGARIKTNGLPIGQTVMPLPYNTGNQGALQSLTGDMADTGQRVLGTAELQVGEGKQDAPVGTTLALIEQATKILDSVHKRLHASQAEEFELLAQCFREHPESFLEIDCRSNKQWQLQEFIDALDNCNLVPQADPNTSSHLQRLMKVMALKQLQGASQGLYDPIAVDTAVLQAIGWSNPEQFFVPPQARGAPPPEMLEMQAKAQADGKRADAAMLTAQARMADAQAKQQSGLGAAQQQPPDPLKVAELRLKGQALQQDAVDDHMEAQNRERDRESQERIALVDLAKEAMKTPHTFPLAEQILGPGVIDKLRTDQPPVGDETPKP